MLEQSTFEQVLDYANRANPYPIYARLRQMPVARQADGSYVVSTYREIVALLNDPRISSDPRPNGADGAGPNQRPHSVVLPGFIRYDPPQHDRLRRQATLSYGPPHTPGRVAGMEPEIARLTNRLIDPVRGKTQIDIVDDFAYPLPVTVICELLGVPREDEPRRPSWSSGNTSLHWPSAIASSPAPTCFLDSSPARDPKGRWPPQTSWTPGFCCSSPVTRPP
jgi:cytochrome P450